MDNAVKTHVRDYSRQTFAPRHLAVVRAFAEALFLDEAQPFEVGELDAVALECDRFVSPASKTLRFGLRAILDVIRLLPLFVMGRFALFEDLALKDRVTMLERMDRSPVALLPLMLVAYKTMLAMLFFENPRELAAAGYPGPERHRYRLATTSNATSTPTPTPTAT